MTSSEKKTQSAIPVKHNLKLCKAIQKFIEKKVNISTNSILSALHTPE